MADRMSQILIETIVRRTLRSIRDEPERNTRNLVDMALQFSDGRFQQNFFRAAQTMLQNENSPYYGLIQDTAVHVDEERLLTFGMNVGYRGCTLGAADIRRIEQEEGFNIPWLISLHLGAEPLRWSPVIRQGMEMGIHTWALYPEAEPQEACSLALAHPESAFVLFCEAGTVTPALAAAAAESRNLMLAVGLDSHTQEVCGQLREHGLLYGVWCRYTGGHDTDQAGEALLCKAEAAHPVLTILEAAPGCPEAAQRRMAVWAKAAREQQRFRTIPWEMEGDCALVDAVISGDACAAVFDAGGGLLPSGKWNLFRQPLKTILQEAYPKA